MRKGMKEPYVEDLASYGGPESCVGDPRGRSEALTGVHAGRLLSLENSIVQGADAVVGAEGNIAGGVIASRQRALRGRRAGTRVRSPHAENREMSRLPALVMMPRPGWFAGCHIGERWPAGGTLRR